MIEKINNNTLVINKTYQIYINKSFFYYYLSCFSFASVCVKLFCVPVVVPHYYLCKVFIYQYKTHVIDVLHKPLLYIYDYI